jgi:PAS domain S-box-containing protein
MEAHLVSSSSTLVSPLRASLAEHAPLTSAEYEKIFCSMIERTGSGFAVLDTRLCVRESNVALSDQCGLPPDGLRNRCFTDLLHPSLREQVERQFGRIVDGRADRFVERLVAADGREPVLTGVLTGMRVPGGPGAARAIVVLVSPGAGEGERQPVNPPRRILSETNARILEGVATGATTVQLAARLFMSRQTIDYHVSGMMRLFKVPNRVALVSKAYSMGLFGTGAWPPKVHGDCIHP